MRLGLILWAALLAAGVSAQEAERPRLQAGTLSGELKLDGVLDEPAWAAAPAIDGLTMVEPRAGGVPTAATVVRMMAGAGTLVFGIRCLDPDPAGIVSFTKERDGDFDAEDHVVLVLDPFQDGRSGYVFAVNPGGARLDALVEPGGEDVDDQLGRGVGGRYAAGQRGLDGGDPHPGAVPELPAWPGRMGLQRAAPHPAASGDEPLGEPGAGLLRVPVQPGGPARRPARVRPGAGPGRAAFAGHRLPQRFTRRAARRGAGAEPGRDPAAGNERPGLAHREHRLRGDGGGHPRDEPHAFSAVLPGEAHVLPAGVGHLLLRARHRRGEPAPVLQPAHRAGGGAGSAHPGRPQDHRPHRGHEPRSAGGPHAGAVRAGARRHHGRRAPAAERPRGVTRRHPRRGGRPPGAARELGGGRRLRLPDLELPREQELPGRRLGAGHRTAGPGRFSRADGLRPEGGLSERPLGLLPHLSPHRRRLRPVAGVRAAAGASTPTTAAARTRPGPRAGSSGRCSTGCTARSPRTWAGNGRPTSCSSTPVEWQLESGDGAEPGDRADGRAPARAVRGGGRCERASRLVRLASSTRWRWRRRPSAAWPPRPAGRSAGSTVAPSRRSSWRWPGRPRPW